MDFSRKRNHRFSIFYEQCLKRMFANNKKWFYGHNGWFDGYNIIKSLEEFRKIIKEESDLLNFRYRPQPQDKPFKSNFFTLEGLPVTGQCEICGINKAKQRHHLIPVSMEKTNLEQKPRLLMVCRNCHREIHRRFSNYKLALELNSKEKLRDEFSSYL